jgi:hypothetical protein
MSLNNQLPLNDTDFWWLRYVCGLVLPIGLAIFGVYSLISRHSYALIRTGGRALHFVPVQGEQAILMGVAYLGVALILFANCYAQYHETMAYWYQWILALGLLATLFGMGWCSWIFITG